MKAFIGIFMLVAAFVIVGCSDQAPATGPVESASVSVPQQTMNVPVTSLPGDLSVDFIVLDANSKEQFHVSGSIGYDYELKTNKFVLTTYTNVTIRSLEADTEPVVLKRTMEHASTLDAKGIGQATERQLLTIPGRGSWTLVTEFLSNSTHPWIGSINLLSNKTKTERAPVID